MVPAHPSLVGLWRPVEGDRKHLEKLLEETKAQGGDEAAVKELEATVELWKRLVVRFDAVRILGEIGDGLDARGYAVKDAWTAADGMPVVDLELRGAGSTARKVSVLFTAPNQVLFQSDGIRLPLQRTGA
jgi:hypothetical protein